MSDWSDESNSQNVTSGMQLFQEDATYYQGVNSRTELFLVTIKLPKYGKNIYNELIKKKKKNHTHKHSNICRGVYLQWTISTDLISFFLGEK